MEDVGGDASTVLVLSATCMCEDGFYGIIQPDVQSGGVLDTCTEIEAGAAQHQFQITAMVDQDESWFANATQAESAKSAVQAMAWGISGLEYANIEFDEAMENAVDNTMTDVKFTLIFPSEDAAIAGRTRFIATAGTLSTAPIEIIPNTLNVVELTVDAVVVTPLSGASQVSSSVAAAVAAAVLLW